MALRRAAIDLEKASTIPDVTIGAGIRRFAETDDDAFLVGLSIPIPVFGLNPGGIREATSALAQARENRRASEVAVRTALSRTYLALSASHRSEEHTSELQSLMRIPYAVFCLKKKKK